MLQVDSKASLISEIQSQPTFLDVFEFESFVTMTIPASQSDSSQITKNQSSLKKFEITHFEVKICILIWA